MHVFSITLSTNTACARAHTRERERAREKDHLGGPRTSHIIWSPSRLSRERKSERTRVTSREYRSRALRNRPSTHDRSTNQRRSGPISKTALQPLGRRPYLLDDGRQTADELRAQPFHIARRSAFSPVSRHHTVFFDHRHSTQRACAGYPHAGVVRSHVLVVGAAVVARERRALTTHKEEGTGTERSQSRPARALGGDFSTHCFFCSSSSSSSAPMWRAQGGNPPSLYKDALALVYSQDDRVPFIFAVYLLICILVTFPLLATI